MDFPIFYPEKEYPDLYQDVMSFRIFADSKTFADAIPTVSVDEINALYQKIDCTQKAPVAAFVAQWFQLPEEKSIPIIEAQPIKLHIESLWDLLIRQPEKIKFNSSLIPLPFSYVVPGGRFREIYYWDSYFTMLGLKESSRIEIIRNMIANFAWLLDQFGHIPNGNRSYFLSRSQPPYFSLMVELLAGIEGDSIYGLYLPQLLREYNFWMDGTEEENENSKRRIRVGKQQFLNRYYDDADLPRAESYAEDVLLKNENPSRSEMYRDLRAACESGWDFSSRWLSEDQTLAAVHTTDFIPVDLNCLLYLLEKTIEKSLRHTGDHLQADRFEELSITRSEVIRQRLWDDDAGIFNDYNDAEQTYGTPSLAMTFPLFAGIATPMQAMRTIEYLSDHFLKPGGWITTNEYTGQQWDAPNGWAPLQWITFLGLMKYGATDLAQEGAGRWLHLNEKVFEQTGRLMEKYNVEDLSLDAGGGEYPVQDGFGWTNGVYLALSNELKMLTG